MSTKPNRHADYEKRRRLAYRYEQENRLTPDGLPPGAWVRHGLTMKFVPAPRPIQRFDFLFPENERRDAHRRYWLGDREPSTVLGEREYQRDAKRRARAARIASGRDAA